jgi:hypothetical protein
MKINFPKISLAISVIICSLLIFGFLSFYGKINDFNTKSEQDLATWQIEATRREDIRLLNRSIQQNVSDRELLETHFAKSSNIVPFLDSIETLALKAEADARVDSVNVGGDGSTLVVGLQALGNFTAIYKFLTLLENSPYEISFLSVDMHKAVPLSNPDKKGPDLRWEAVFKIQLLSFIP